MRVPMRTAQFSTFRQEARPTVSKITSLATGFARRGIVSDATVVTQKSRADAWKRFAITGVSEAAVGL